MSTSRQSSHLSFLLNIWLISSSNYQIMRRPQLKSLILSLILGKCNDCSMRQRATANCHWIMRWIQGIGWFRIGRKSKRRNKRNRRNRRNRRRWCACVCVFIREEKEQEPTAPRDQIQCQTSSHFLLLQPPPPPPSSSDLLRPPLLTAFFLSVHYTEDHRESSRIFKNLLVSFCLSWVLLASPLWVCFHHLLISIVLFRIRIQRSVITLPLALYQLITIVTDDNWF